MTTMTDKEKETAIPETACKVESMKASPADASSVARLHVATSSSKNEGDAVCDLDYQYAAALQQEEFVIGGGVKTMYNEFYDADPNLMFVPVTVLVWPEAYFPDRNNKDAHESALSAVDAFMTFLHDEDIEDLEELAVRAEKGEEIDEFILFTFPHFDKDEQQSATRLATLRTICQFITLFGAEGLNRMVASLMKNDSIGNVKEILETIHQRVMAVPVRPSEALEEEGDSKPSHVASSSTTDDDSNFHADKDRKASPVSVKHGGGKVGSDKGKGTATTVCKEECLKSLAAASSAMARLPTSKKSDTASDIDYQYALALQEQEFATGGENSCKEELYDETPMDNEFDENMFIMFRPVTALVWPESDFTYLSDENNKVVRQCRIAAEAFMQFLKDGGIDHLEDLAVYSDYYADDTVDDFLASLSCFEQEEEQQAVTRLATFCQVCQFIALFGAEDLHQMVDFDINGKIDNLEEALETLHQRILAVAACPSGVLKEEEVEKNDRKRCSVASASTATATDDDDDGSCHVTKKRKASPVSVTQPVEIDGDDGGGKVGAVRDLESKGQLLFGDF